MTNTVYAVIALDGFDPRATSEVSRRFYSTLKAARVEARRACAGDNDTVSRSAHVCVVRPNGKKGAYTGDIVKHVAAYSSRSRKAWLDTVQS
jgi:hypothetical protein